MCAWVCERACVYYYYNRASVCMYVCMYVCMFVCYATTKCVASRASRVYDPRKQYYFLEIHPVILSTNSQITFVVITYNC